MKVPLLVITVENEQFELFIDSSSVSLGAMLTRSGKVIAYALRTLALAERNYAITERECLAVM